MIHLVHVDIADCTFCFYFLIPQHSSDSPLQEPKQVLWPHTDIDSNLLHEFMRIMSFTVSITVQFLVSDTSTSAEVLTPASMVY